MAGNDGMGVVPKRGASTYPWHVQRSYGQWQPIIFE
jgi:hypothetical protein